MWQLSTATTRHVIPLGGFLEHQWHFILLRNVRKLVAFSGYANTIYFEYKPVIDYGSVNYSCTINYLLPLSLGVANADSESSSANWRHASFSTTTTPSELKSYLLFVI